MIKVTATMDWCISLLPLVLIGTLPVTLALGPPTVTQEIHRWQHVKAGETVRLACPVRADPTPFYQWYKDEETINAGWDRHREVNSGLRIKDVMEEDSGNYECKVTNGFGSVVVQYYLHVSPNNSDEVVTPPPDFQGKYYPSDRVPFFVRMDQMSTDPIHKPIGANIRLKCKAEGDPKPSIIWLKDGRVIQPEGDSSRHPHWTLRLHSVGLKDSGKYTCRVFNRAGSISFNYTIVIEDTVDAPRMPGFPVNLTVPLGDVAVFRCEVSSPVEPRIKWLKLVETPQHGRKTNSTVHLQGKDYNLLNKTSEVHEQRDGSWLNKLVLYKVTERDAGHYICLAANSMGYSVRHAFLTVYSNRGSRANSAYDEFDTPNASLPLIIAVPAAVIVIIVIISIYVLHRRRSQSQNKSKARAQCRVPPMAPMPDKPTFDPYQAYQTHHLHPMHPQQQQLLLQQQQQQQHPHMNHMNITPNTALMHGAAPSRERILKNYDVHSDVSIPKVPLSPQSQMQNYPQHHMPYGC